MYLTAVENVVDIIPTQIIANLLYIAILAKIISIYHVLKKNARIMVRTLEPLNPEYMSPIETAGKIANTSLFL